MTAHDLIFAALVGTLAGLWWWAERREAHR